MDYLTGVKRHSSKDDEPSSTSSNPRPKRRKEEPHFDFDDHYPTFIPELYKKENALRIPTEEPDPDFPLSDIPSDTKAALLLVRQLFPVDYFRGRLPPIILQSQLNAIVTSKNVLDIQLRKLAADGEILVFSNDLSGGASNFIIFYSDFVKLEREGIYQRFVSQVLAPTTVKQCQDEEGERVRNNFRHILKDDLLKKWKFRENEIRQLVNSGYLGTSTSGVYCLSLPGAGQFMKVYKQGDKNIRSFIKRSKFGAVLQHDFEKRDMKNVPLGIKYHLYDLLGSGNMKSTATTSGPLLRIREK